MKLLIKPLVLLTLTSYSGCSHIYKVKYFYMCHEIYNGKNFKNTQYPKMYCIKYKNTLIEPISITKSFDTRVLESDTSNNSKHYSINYEDTVGYSVLDFKKKSISYISFLNKNELKVDSTSMSLKYKKGLLFNDNINILNYSSSQIKYDTFLNGYNLKYLDTSFLQTGIGKMNIKLFFSNELKIPSFLNSPVFLSNTEYNPIGLIVTKESILEKVSFLPQKQDQNNAQIKRLIDKIETLKYKNKNIID